MIKIHSTQFSKKLMKRKESYSIKERFLDCPGENQSLGEITSTPEDRKMITNKL